MLGNGVRSVVSHECGFPGARTLLGLVLEIAHSNPQQSTLVGDGGVHLASSRRATHSVPEGAIGIQLLYVCLIILALT